MEHRSSTRALHLTLFCAVPFASFHVRCFFSNSAILICHQVCWALPLFRLPCGFHSTTSALLTTCPSAAGLPSVWPIEPQARCLISCSIGHCPVIVSKSPCCWFFLATRSLLKMFLSLLLMNTYHFCSSPLVSLQVQNHTRAPPSHLTQRLSC